MLSKFVDTGGYNKSHEPSTAGLTAAAHQTSIEIAWLKSTLASQQVKMLHALKGVGIGTNKVEQFLWELEKDDIL